MRVEFVHQIHAAGEDLISLLLIVCFELCVMTDLVDKAPFNALSF